METARNPLFWASVRRSRAAPTAARLAEVERAAKPCPNDKDLIYLLATQYTKAGRYDDAAALYREVLRVDPGRRGRAEQPREPRVRARRVPGGHRALQAGAEQAADGDPRPRSTTTSPSPTCSGSRCSPPTRRCRRPTAWTRASSSTYDRLWKYDKGDYAVVDLGLDRGRGLRRSSTARADGHRPTKNARRARWRPVARVAPAALLTRFAGFLGVVAAGGGRLCASGAAARRSRMRCLKCGTPFCRRCHLRRGGGGALHAVLPPLRGARRRLGPGPQPEAARGAGGGGAARAASSASSPLLVPGRRPALRAEAPLLGARSRPASGT